MVDLLRMEKQESEGNRAELNDAVEDVKVKGLKMAVEAVIDAVEDVKLKGVKKSTEAKNVDAGGGDTELKEAGQESQK